jgi:hypothetical protein
MGGSKIGAMAKRRSWERGGKPVPPAIAVHRSRVRALTATQWIGIKGKRREEQIRK